METPADRPRSFGTGIRWLSEAITGALASLQFLTVVPPLARRPFTERELGRAVGFFPLVGALLGGVLVGLDYVLGLLWPSALTAALLVAAWVLLTGGLHLDGLLDSCDGLFGARTAADRLRIMRDPRVGSFAVIGGVLLLLVKYAALAACQQRLWPLLLAPVLGRWAMALAVVVFPYVRPEGLGRAMKDHAGWADLAVATVICGIAAALCPGWCGEVAFVVAGAVTLGIACFALARVSGLTGDVYGAICELVEVSVLLTLLAVDGE